MFKVTAYKYLPFFIHCSIPSLLLASGKPTIIQLVIAKIILFLFSVWKKKISSLLMRFVVEF